MTNLWHSNDSFVTVHNKCTKIPPSTSMHFAIRVRRSRVVRMSWSSHFFTQAAASKMGVSNSSGLSIFILQTSFFIQPYKHKFNLIWPGGSGNSTPQTIQDYKHIYIKFFLAQRPIISFPKILTSASESPCIRSGVYQHLTTASLNYSYVICE